MKCSFCGKDITPGTGTMYVKKDAKVFYFCTMKCQKNMIKLKRKPRVIRWTESFKEEKAANKKTQKPKDSEKAKKAEVPKK